ncbi:MAG: antitoxin VbhA family protein [Acutalibacteraceae bacterium]
MSPQVYAKRISAIKLADTLNKIEGAPVSEYARELSDKWAKGEITGQQMKKALIDKHKTKK